MRAASLAVLLIVLSSFLAACSGDDDGEEGQDESTPLISDGSSGGPAIEAAPGARLKDASGKDTAAPAGTRCWSRVCVDMIGPITPPTPAKVKAGEALSVAFDAGAPTSVEYSWMGNPQQSAPVEGGVVAWLPEPQEKATLPLKAPDKAGRYLLIAFTRYQGKGDISYAWYLQVE